jgi:hypothetical protein
MPFLETVPSLHDLRLSRRRRESFGLASRKSEIERFLYIQPQRPKATFLAASLVGQSGFVARNCSKSSGVTKVVKISTKI